MSDQDDPLATMHPSHTPRSSLGSGALSYNSSTSISPSNSSSGSHGSAKTAVSECLGAWINYLQILNNLCASGYRLAQSISALEQWGDGDQMAGLAQGVTAAAGATAQPVATQFATAWDDLARATAVATSTVKSHIVSVLQDFVTQSLPVVVPEQQEPNDIQRIRDHNQQIIMESAQTMINIQHQFCVASYDSFSPLMCCFMCQAPVGYPHDGDCAMVAQQQPPAASRNQTTSVGDPRSQTPSPHFGSLAINYQRHIATGAVGTAVDSRALLFGSGTSTQASSEQISGGGMASAISNIVMDARGPSPHHEIRGPSPIQGFLENIRGPLPNPGHLLGMKTPFYRGSRSPLNFPLFPLNGQRRWSEAAAGEVKGESAFLDAESHMRRWSMPWEATSKSVKNTVSWHQTKIMPISKLAVPASKSGSDKSQTTTPDSNWHSSATSQDGLAEAIQLLSCRPARIYQPQQPQPPLGPPFIEEPIPPTIPAYEMWSDRSQRLPCIKFNRDRDDDATAQHHT